MLSGYQTFGDFLDGAEGIATNILADRLAKLKTAGVLVSKPVAGDRRKVHYRLTNKGVSLVPILDRKSTRLNSSHQIISYAVFCFKKKKKNNRMQLLTDELPPS